MALDRMVVERLLRRVQKPARYMGGELNSVVKPDAAVRVALSYPDLYEVGMSNNGIRILYDLANAMEGVACERVFAVEHDFEEALRQAGVPLYTLETFTPLRECDAVGFNCSHEMLCTGLLQVLDLGGVPLERTERGDGDPIVIAGGGAVSNPLPLFDFVDLFFIGDGEEGFVEILTALREGKGKRLPRREIIASLGRVPGVLVTEEFSRKGGPSPQSKVLKRTYRGPMRDPLRPVLPSMRIVQNRAVVEITRGCPNLCKFCHAGYYDLPYRAAPCTEAADRALTILRNTGYDELTLSSLSVSDYRSLGDLLNQILPELMERGISVSLPSLKVDTATLPVIDALSDVRRTSLTFAVESAAEEQRLLAHKRLAEGDLLSIVRTVFAKGWRLIKLYFMVGLPGCEGIDEAAAIIRLLKSILGATGGRMELNVTISPFVPKPHTPFQREEQRGIAYCEEVLARLRKGLPRMVKLKNHDFRASLLEGLIARGDERLGRVIAGAYRRGCRLDSWSEFLRFDRWQESLDRDLPGWETYTGARAAHDPLPWDIIDTGYGRVAANMGRRTAAPAGAVKERAHAIDAGRINEARRRFQDRYTFTARFRLRLTKRGMIKFVSHMDYLELLKRALRVADAPVSYTQGFNKRERIGASHPLPLGFESECELFDLDFYREADAGFLERLAAAFPAGITVLGGHYVGKNEGIMAATVAAGYRVEFRDPARCRRVMEGFEAGLPFAGVKVAGVSIPFNEAVLDYRSEGEGMMTIVTPSLGGAIRVDALVRQRSGLDEVPGDDTAIIRTVLYRRDDQGLSSIF